MADREAVYKLAFEIARQEYNQSLKSIADLAKSVDVVGDAFTANNKAVSEFQKELASLKRQESQLKQLAKAANIDTAAIDRADELSDRMEVVKTEARQAADAVAQLADNLSEADRRAQRLDIADEQFDVISRRVGLAGDFQSNLGALRGLSGAGGVGSLATGLDIAGELVVLTEELPRLKQAIANLPDVAKFAAQQIGGVGFGLIGGLAALAVAFKLLSDAAKDEQEALAAELDARQRVIDLINEGATEEEARQKLADLNVERQREQENLAFLENELENLDGKFVAIKTSLSPVLTLLSEFDRDIGALAGSFVGFNAENILTRAVDVTGLSGEFEELNDRTGEARAGIIGLSTEIAFLEAELKAGAFAANEAAIALDRANQEFVDSAIFNANELERELRVRSEVNNLLIDGNREALQSEFDRLRAEQDIQLGRADLELDAIRRSQEAGLEARELADSYANTTRQIRENAFALEEYGAALATLDIGARLEELGVALSSDSLKQIEQTRIEGEKAAVSAITTRYQEELAFANFIKGATADSITQRRTALLTEQDLIKSTIPELARLAPTSEAAAAELEAFNTRLQTIDRELGRLNTSGVAQVVGNLQSQLATEITTIQTRLAERIVQIEAQAAEKRADIARDFAQGLRDIEQEALEARQEAQADFAEGSIDIAKDLAKRRAEIERRAALDVRRALEDRDAVALNRARRSREEELTEAQIAAQEAQEELAENYAQQLKTIETETAKQRQELQRKYAQQLRDLQQATAQSINQERIKAQAEIATKQQAYNAQLQQLQSFGSASTSLLSQFASLGVGYVQSFVTGSLSALQQAAAQQAGGTIGDILGTNASLIGTSSPSVNASFTIQATSREAMAQEVYNNLNELITLAGR